MGKNPAVRISARLISLPVRHGIRQHLAVGGIDFSADDPSDKQILPLIVRTVNKLFTFHKLKPGKISHQADKHRQERIRNHRKFTVPAALPPCTGPFSTSVLLRRGPRCRCQIRSVSCFRAFLSSFRYPCSHAHASLLHPALKYTTPESPKT